MNHFAKALTAAITSIILAKGIIVVGIAVAYAPVTAEVPPEWQAIFDRKHKEQNRDIPHELLTQLFAEGYVKEHNSSADHNVRISRVYRGWYEDKNKWEIRFLTEDKEGNLQEWVANLRTEWSADPLVENMIQVSEYEQRTLEN